MGLFWGTSPKKEMPPPPKTPEQIKHEELIQELTRPMELCYLVSGVGSVKAGEEFSYLIRRINDATYKNNCVIREVRDLVRELLVENQELKKRIEQLEQQYNSASVR